MSRLAVLSTFVAVSLVPAGAAGAATATTKPKKTGTTTPTVTVPAGVPTPGPSPVSLRAPTISAAQAEVAKARQSGDQRALATALRSLGLRYLIDKRPADAVKALSEAVDRSQADGAELAESLDLLGWAQSQGGRPGDAAVTLKRSLATRDALGVGRAGGRPTEVAGTLQLLGVAQRTSGDVAGSLETYKRLIRLSEDGAGGISKVDAYEAYALALLLSGRGTEAIAPLEVAAGERKPSDGAAYAGTLQLQGWAYLLAGRPTDSLAALRKALAVRESINPNGPETMAILQLMTAAARQAGDRATELSSAQRVLELARKGVPGISVSEASSDYGLALLLSGRGSEAAPILREAVKSFGGAENAASANALHNLGWALLKDSPAEAVTVLRQALAIRDRLKLPEADQSAQFLGYALWGTKDQASAEPLFKRVYDAAKARGALRRTIATAANDYALALLLVSKPELAVPVAQSAVAAWREEREGGDPLGDALHALGWAKYATRDYSGALEALVEAVEIRQRTGNPSLPETQQFLALAIRSLG